MFMTTKTHEQLLDAAITKERKDAAFDLVSAQNSFRAQLSITEQYRGMIADMQHFYNKGRAVHAADVRYEAKKRAEKIKVNVL